MTDKEMRRIRQKILLAGFTCEQFLEILTAANKISRASLMDIDIAAQRITDTIMKL